MDSENSEDVFMRIPQECHTIESAVALMQSRGMIIPNIPGRVQATPTGHMRDPMRLNAHMRQAGFPPGPSEPCTLHFSRMCADTMAPGDIQPGNRYPGWHATSLICPQEQKDSHRKRSRSSKGTEILSRHCESGHGHTRLRCSNPGPSLAQTFDDFCYGSGASGNGLLSPSPEPGSVSTTTNEESANDSLWEPGVIAFGKLDADHLEQDAGSNVTSFEGVGDDRNNHSVNHSVGSSREYRSGILRDSRMHIENGMMRPCANMQVVSKEISDWADVPLIPDYLLWPHSDNHD